MADDVNNLLLQVDAQVELARRNLHSLEKEVGSFQRQTEKHLDRVDRNFDKLGTSVGKFKTVIATLGVGVGFAALERGAKGILDAADDLATAAAQAGVGVERFQTLQAAFRALEIDAAAFDKIMKRLIVTQGDAAAGTKNEATKALTELGITADITSGKIQTTDQLLDAIAVQMGKIDSPAKRAAIAVDLVGQRLGPQLAAAIGDGGKALKQAEQDFRDVGNVVSEDMVNKLADANEVWDRTLESMKSRAIIFAADTITALEDVRAFFAKFAKDVDLPWVDSAGAKSILVGRAGGAGGYAGQLRQQVGDIQGELRRELKKQSAAGEFGDVYNPSIRELRGKLKEARAELAAYLASPEYQRAKASFKAIFPDEKGKDEDNGGGGGGKPAKDAKRIFTPSELRQGLDLPPVELPISLDADAALVDLDALRVDADGLKQTVADLNGVFSETFDAELVERIRQIDEAFAQDLSRTLGDVIVYGDDLGDSLESAFKRAASAMLEAIIQAQILGPLLENMGKSGGGGPFGSLLKFGSSLLTGGSSLDTSFAANLGDRVNDYSAQFRAAGGPVEAGRPYMVGERGPELIVPRLKAHVIPNHKLGGERTIRVDVTPSPYFDVRVTQISGQTVAQAVPAIVNASTRNTMDRASRRPLPRGLG